MKDLFPILKQRQEEGKDSVLITIVEGSGSLPRTAGAYMIVGEEGRICGTIGGGNLEFQCIQIGQKKVGSNEVYVESYNLDNQKAATLGMVCGGNAKVLFYGICATDEDAKTWIETGWKASMDKQSFCLLLPLEAGLPKIRFDEIDAYEGVVTLDDKKQYYAQTVSYDGRVIIFGGGHLTQETVPVLDHLGFRCVVVEDRDDFLKEKLFPKAEERIKADFHDLASYLTVGKDDYICIMTRGHVLDLDAERFALNTDAKYIGVVGSKKKTAYVNEKLKSYGFTDEQLNRVVTPIGVSIQAQTPAELAISIAAQLIQVRANN